jgi:hypothetical protein
MHELFTAVNALHSAAADLMCTDLLDIPTDLQFLTFPVPAQASVPKVLASTIGEQHRQRVTAEALFS